MNLPLTLVSDPPFLVQRVSYFMESRPNIVTALREHPIRRGRFAIEVDGAELAVIGIDAVADLSLQTGKTLTLTDLRALEVASRRTKLLDRALNLLAVHARSTFDLRLRLRRPDGSEGDVEWVVGRLKSLGYLDDATYARHVAHSRIAIGGTSKRQVLNELFKSGISREIANEAIEAAMGDAELDEYSAAVAAARKRVKALTKLSEDVRRRRLYAFLARRGFETDVVNRVVRDVLRATE